MIDDGRLLTKPGDGRQATVKQPEIPEFHKKYHIHGTFGM